MALACPSGVRSGLIAVHKRRGFLGFGGGPAFAIYRLDQLAQPLSGFSSASDNQALFQSFFDEKGIALVVCKYSSNYNISVDVFAPVQKKTLSFKGDMYQGLGGVTGTSTAAFGPIQGVLTVASGWVQSGRVSLVNTVKSLERSSAVILYALQPGQKLFSTLRLSWSPDRKYLAQSGTFAEKLTSASSCFGVCLWEFSSVDVASFAAKHVRTSVIARTTKNVASMYSIEQLFHPNSRILFIGSSLEISDTIVMYDVIADSIIARTPSLGTTTASMALSKSGRYLFAGGKNGELRVWIVDSTDGKWSFAEVTRVSFAGEIHKICLSPEDHALVVAYRSEGGCSLCSVSLDNEMVE
jgi:WD40 repeat protein